MIQHVVWDWNGTLADDYAIVLRCVVNDVCAQVGLPPVDADGYRRHYTRPVKLFWERLAGRALRDAEFADLDERFHHAYRRRVAAVPLAADAVAALALARDSGLSPSLLSLWRHHDLVERVQALGIAGFFVRVEGLRGPGGVVKAGQLAAHLDALGTEAGLRVAPGAVLVVGDTLDDAAAARAVGARCVLYDGGTHHPEALAATGLPVAATLVEALRAGGLTATGAAPGPTG